MHNPAPGHAGSLESSARLRNVWRCFAFFGIFLGINVVLSEKKIGLSDGV